MVGLRWTRLAEKERDEFLGDGGTGVIAFVDHPEVPPAAFPVSYGYAADSGNFYFRLSFPVGTKKDEFVAQPMTFVTYDKTEEGWQSVVASGYLEELTERRTDSVAIQTMWAVNIPTVDIFEKPPEEIPFHDFRLQPDELTGRKEIE